MNVKGSKTKELGIEIPKSEITENFTENEGGIEAIYGHIRSGKTTEAVRRMFHSLSNGRCIYTNIKLDLDNIEFDDRNVPSYALKSLINPSKRFYVFDKRNYHYFNPATGICDGKKVFDPTDPESIIIWLNSLTDCEIYFDEGQKILNSYEGTRVSIEKLMLIDETGHMNRLIVIITQRTQKIHVNARYNVNRFFKCSKGFAWLPYPAFRFYVTEYQDMIGNDVDETVEFSKRKYTMSANQKYWGLFDTHYLRMGKKTSQKLYIRAFKLNTKEKLLAILTYAKNDLNFYYSNIISHFRR